MKFPFEKKHIPFIVLGFFGVLMLFMGIANHYLFKTFTYDYANYNFAFWDYSHFRISQIPTFRGNFLQDHFSFTLFYFIPVYWLLNWLTGSYTLIVIQTLLILIAAWYSHKLIKLKTDNPFLTVGVLLYFFLLLGRYTAFGTDVNLAIMSACIIPVFLYFFEIKKYIFSFVLLILSLFSRENIALWFVFIFIVLLISHRKERKAILFSLIGIIVSLVYFILLFKIFIPQLETPDVKYALFNYSALGANPGEAFLYILQHPFESIKLLFVNHLDNPEYNLVKLEFYYVYLVSGGFVLLFRPKYLIWFIPIVAQKVLNDDFFRWGIATYYSVEVVTLLPLSVFLALASIKSIKLQKYMVVATCILTTSMTIYKMDSVNNQVPWTFYSSKIKFYSKHFYEAPFSVKKVNKLLKQIPEDAKVSASNVLTPHLAQRRFIYFFPVVKDADYIVFSLFDNNYLLSSEGNDKERNKYLNSPEWEIISKEYPVFLLKRRTIPIQPGDQVKELSFWRKLDTVQCNFEEFDYNKNHILLSNSQKADTLTNSTAVKKLSGQFGICLKQENPYSQAIEIKNIDKLEQIEISVWCYNSTNKGFIVIDNKNGFYKNSNTIVETNTERWNKIKLISRFPMRLKSGNAIVYLWNAGTEPAYFDDMEIIKKYR